MVATAREPIRTGPGRRRSPRTGTGRRQRIDPTNPRLGSPRARILTTMDDWEQPRGRDSVKAVYDDQLVVYLRSLGLNPDGVLGRCKFDDTEVTVDNLTALFPQSGALKLVCSNRECIAGLQELIREGVVRL